MPEPVKLKETIKAAIPATAILNDTLSLIERAHEAYKGHGLAGIPTGFKYFDRIMGGLQTGLHIVAAEPGAGKTAFALNAARHASRLGFPVVYASFDETPERLLLKTVTAQEDLCASDFSNGEHTPQEFAQAAANYGHDNLKRLSFVAADSMMSARELAQQLEDHILQTEQDRGLLVVDYLQPWAAALAAKNGTDYRMAIGQAAQRLRELANKLNIPVLMISAQNRSGQGTDRMTSLRESSDLEYGADSISLLTNVIDEDKKYVGGGWYARNLHIAKNRFGEKDTSVRVRLNGKTQKLEEIPDEE